MAFLILSYNVTDSIQLSAYREAATPVLLGPNSGKLITSTDETIHLPEATSSGTHTVILEFESVDRARAVYDSAEYQALVRQRLAASNPTIAMIVPSM
ncbi:DUF1330 domain-containing protein [Arthrobacter sp. SX1312]|uniref:DUF1330 domain-containing protein n=1 Tax=Arthrobacter sp. SX1312 TaxID=2058896 RepID=UPI000CE3E065|nr:DUF1330 domain-containing protein [Arthrobacter sp. SX1312]